MPHLMEQAASEFCRCLVSRSLGCQRVGQINTFIVPHEVVLGAKMEEVTRHLSLRIISTVTCYCRPTQDILGIGDPLSLGLLRLIPVAFSRDITGEKKQETANDLLPEGGMKMKKP
jgi:hypothetical protein